MFTFPTLTDEQTELLHKICANDGATIDWLKWSGCYDKADLEVLHGCGLIERGRFTQSAYPTQAAMDWYNR